MYFMTRDKSYGKARVELKQKVSITSIPTNHKNSRVAINKAEVIKISFPSFSSSYSNHLI